MQRTVRRISRHRRRAGVVVQVAVMSTLICGVGALAVDMAVLYTVQTEIQVATDAAALAAAAQLVSEGDVREQAIAAADEYAGRNPAMGLDLAVYEQDVEFGRADYNEATGKYTFLPGGENFDAVRVTLRHVESASPGEPPEISVPLMFANIFGRGSKHLEGRAAAVLIPRDIALVIDLSNSMCWDSQVRYWDRGDGGYSNLRDVWCALDGPEPDRPYIPGSELETQYAADTGPTIGVMSVWGDPLLPGLYDPTTDPGLYYLPRGQDWSNDPAVEQLLIAQGYNEWERWAILTNETQGYLTPESTDSLGFSNRVVWQENSSSGRDRITVYLTSDGSEATSALSHLTLSLPSCAWATARSTASSQGNHRVQTVSPDPVTGYSGIKFDETDLGENGVVETEWFSFEVPSYCGIEDIHIVTKADTGYAVAHQDFESVDPSNNMRWRYRVAVALGLAQWDSGMSGSGGDDDGMIEGEGELAWIPKFNACWNWSWTDYIDWPRTSSTYSGANSGFKHRYGLKTFTDFLMEQKPESYRTCDLWATPEQPLRATKDAVQTMADVLDVLDSLDHLSLETFATTTRHEVDLTENPQEVPDVLYQRQSGHYDRCTNMGGGLQRAIDELQSVRARSSAHKVIMLMSDGAANIDGEGNYNATTAREYALRMAQAAADQRYRVYTVSVGYNVDRPLMQEIAEVGNGEEFYAVGSPEEYTAQLEEIFRTLGGRRPVALIE